MRPHRSSVLLGVLAAGLMLTQQACTSTGRDVRRPVAFTVPADAPASANQVVIRPLPSTEAALTVDDRGHLTASHGETPFVLHPVGDKYLIQAGPSCMTIKSDKTIVAAACDPTSAGQLFTITPQGPSAYAISNQGAFLQVSASSSVTAEGPLKTTFALG